MDRHPIHQVVAIPLVIACAVLAYFAMYPRPLGSGGPGVCEDGKVSQPLAMKLVGDLLHSVCPT